ncbi:MAG TPA: amidohydrolase family protein [Bryobacteraceae bacterium]|nr:amidohydrolase family protein [Bryobacteraceae bacterium]
MSEVGLIEDGSVLIVDGLVASFGPSRRVENLADAKAAEIIDANGHVVIPGFVDSHTHLIGPPIRTAQSKSSSERLDTPAALFLASAAFIRSTAGPTIEHQARRHLAAFLRHGTTTVEVKTGYGLVAGSEAKALRAVNSLGDDIANVVPTLLGAWTRPPDVKADTYIAQLCTDILPRVKEKKSVQMAEIFCDPEGFSEPEARPYAETAARLRLPLKMHVDETGRAGGAALATEVGAVSVSGLNAIDDHDVQALARSQVVCTVLPACMLGSSRLRTPPARLLIDSGAALSLASGFDPALPSTYNMQAVISLACLELGMTVEEALVACTWNAAHALGIAARAGAIAANRPADIVILNVSDYRDIPVYFGANIVAAVLRSGSVVYREGPLQWQGE